MKVVRWTLAFILVIAIFPFGCATLESPLIKFKKRTPPSSSHVSVISDEILHKRVEGLSNRILKYRALERQLKGEGDLKALADLQQSRRNAEDLLKTYRQVEKLKGKVSLRKTCSGKGKIYQSVIERLFDGLTELEEEYFEDRDKTRFREEEFLRGYRSDMRKIEGFCVGEYYPQMVESYVNIIEIYGEDLIPAKIRLCYANALFKTDKVNEAIEVARGLMDEGTFDPIEIRANLIDWYLNTENREEALKSFKELSDELNRKKSIFLASRSKIALPVHEGPSESVNILFNNNDIDEEDIRLIEDEAKHAAGGGGDLKKDGGDKKDDPERIEERKVSPDEGLNRANDLMNQRRFEEALGILTRLKDDIENPEEIRKAEDALEALRLEQAKARDEEEEERFMTAKKLMESERYEEAIEKLKELRDGGRYCLESQEMIQRSIDEFATKKRREAANLFLMAKNTTDSMERKELLLRSFELLKEILRKYPKSSYSGKIVKNIEAVKEEILKIDPQFSHK